MSLDDWLYKYSLVPVVGTFVLAIVPAVVLGALVYYDHKSSVIKPVAFPLTDCLLLQEADIDVVFVKDRNNILIGCNIESEMGQKERELR